MRKRRVTIGLLAAVAASVAFPAAAADVGVERFQAIYHAVPTDAATPSSSIRRECST